MPDRVDDFIALPRDKQLTVMQRLSPDMQTQLLDQVKQRRSNPATPPAAAPPPAQPGFADVHPGENPVAAFFRGGAGAIKNAFENPSSLLTIPALGGPTPMTGNEQAQQAHSQGVKSQAEDIHSQAEFAKENPAYFAGGVVLPAVALHGLSKFTGPLTRTLEATRKGAQSMVGAGERAVKDTVAKTAKSAGDAAKTTEEQNRAALSKYDTDLREAGQKNVNAHVQYLAAKAETERANALAQKAVDEHNRAQLKAHQQNLDEAARKNLNAHIDYLRKTADTAKENAVRLKEVEEKNLAESKRYEKELADAQRENTAAHVKYKAESAEAEQANAAARAIPDSRAGLEKYVKDKTEDVDVRIEKARNDALVEGNTKYNTLNEKLNTVPADPETIQKAVADARGKIKGSEAEPPILKDISSRLDRSDFVYQGGHKFGPGTPVYESVKASEGGLPGGESKPLSYKDLQGYYSELGTALSKGNLAGDVYTALDTLHEAIGKDMQRIADANGQGPQLAAAREYWRRMKQTFGNSSDAVVDRAGRELKETSPDFSGNQISEYRQRLLGSFDPEIPKLLQDIAAKRDALSKLPSEGTRPTAKAPGYPEEKTVKPPQMEKPPEPKAGPSYPDETAVEPPKLKPPADQKAPPEYPEEKTVEPPKVNPIETPGVNTRTIREQLLDRWTKGETTMSRYDVKRLLGGGFGAMAGYFLGGLEGATIGGAAVTFAPAVISRLIELPSVREWLTRPPAGELETLQKLPNADRIKLTDGLKKIVPQAQAAGIKVSPALVALAGAGPATQQLQRTRAAQQLQPQQ